jgi:hypothetical protein
MPSRGKLLNAVKGKRSEKSFCCHPERAAVSAVILSAAKDPEDLNSPQPLEPFYPVCLYSPNPVNLYLSKNP